MPETATPTMEQAFDDAVKTHSSEQAPAAAEPAAAASEPGETEAAPPTAEQTDEAPDQPASADQETLLTQEEVGKLSPEQQKVYKQMQAAYTQKTQKLASERKALERYGEIISAFETNPEETLKKLGEQLGMRVEKSDIKTPVAQAKTADAMIDRVKGKLSPELQELLLPAFQELADAIRDQEVKPLKERQEAAEMRLAADTAEAQLTSWRSTHTDWQKYEAKMNDLSQEFIPTKTMEAKRYLDTLYTLAKAQDSDVEKTKEVISKMTKAAATSEPRESGVSTSRVSPTAPKRPTLEEAFAAAKRGERWED